MTTPNLTGNWSLDFPNESVKVIQWHGFYSVLLICFCSAFAIISTAGKSMIIYFILYKAPKRPMNTMILLDQVSGSNNFSNETYLLRKPFSDWYFANKLSNQNHDHFLPNYGYSHSWSVWTTGMRCLYPFHCSPQYFSGHWRICHGSISFALRPISKSHSLTWKIDGQINVDTIDTLLGHLDN